MHCPRCKAAKRPDAGTFWLVRRGDSSLFECHDPDCWRTDRDTGNRIYTIFKADPTTGQTSEGPRPEWKPRRGGRIKRRQRQHASPMLQGVSS